MKNKVTNFIVIIFMFIIGAVVSTLLIDLLSAGGIYPSGSDTMYQVFRGDVLYKSLARSGRFPLYNRLMYNGTEPFRYQPPLSPILFAICEFADGGNVFSAYLDYVACIFCLGLITWTAVGIRRKRPVLGLVLGTVWFFLPNNIYTLFVEGSLSKALAYAFLPIVLYLIYQFLEDGQWHHILWLSISFVFVILSDFEFARMVTAGILAFLVIYRFFWRKRRRIVKVLAALTVSFLLCGAFLVPYVKGNVAAEGEEYAAAFFQSLGITLNPVLRMTTNPEIAYFGLSVLIVAILGMLASNRASAPGFISAIIIVILTAASAYSVIRIVPGSEILLMLRFLSIALAMVFVSILYWDKLRKWVLIVFMVIICADCVPSFYWIIGHQTNLAPQKRFAELGEETLVTEAKELCRQRMALFDLSSLGAKGSFLISDYGGEFKSVFGSGWRYSATADNTKRLNSAMSDEYFDYMFDRCLELGADTVIIQKAQAAYGEQTLIRLDKAAERLGYDIIDENEGYMLYHLETPEAYGTKAMYDAIGIGYSAYSLSLAFPNIKETGDDYLDHYSYEYLSQFKTVYLSGFFYEDRIAAESLVYRLSRDGVRVVILADGIPEDRETRSKTFLGVTCNVIQFENGYPILYTKDFGEMDCDLFPLGYAKWVTYYLNGLHEVCGTISDNNVELAFYGTGENENICYIGLNIPFYYYLTLDSNAEKLMQWVMGMDPGILPRREIYPLSVEYGNNEIIINSDVDYINTGLAYHDSFRSSDEIYVDNNLLIVRQGTTSIKVVYPYFVQSILVSLAGLLLLIVLVWYVRRSDLRDRGVIKSSKEDEIESVISEENESEIEDIESVLETEEKMTEEKEEPEEISKEEEPLRGDNEMYTNTEFDIPMVKGDDFDIPFGEQ